MVVDKTGNRRVVEGPQTLLLEYDETLEYELHFNELTQVILNLLQNAMDELLEHKVEHSTIMISTLKEKDTLYIEICDNGRGIDVSIADKIFDPYFSTKKSKNGSGLGLYMSKMIIEEHHGGKFYLNTDKEMTCFTISLPL
jgi:signal transduction histidine kinase